MFVALSTAVCTRRNVALVLMPFNAPPVYKPFLIHAVGAGETNYICSLTFRRRIKYRLPFAGFVRRLPYSTRFQDKG